MSKDKMLGYLLAAILAVSAWGLKELIDIGKLVAALQVNVSNVSARIADIEKPK